MFKRNCIKITPTFTFILEKMIFFGKDETRSEITKI